MILLIDNYDSFTYNLYQYFLEANVEVRVCRNDEVTLNEINYLKPEGIVLSPGPGSPNDAGICLEVVKHFYQKIPMLGVCLGHQVIAQAFGGRVVKAVTPMHGKTSLITHDGKGVYTDIPNPFLVTRYHSLIVEKESLPDALILTSQTKNQEMMGLRHRHYRVEGVQFHPESILTEHGRLLIKNFIKTL